MSDYNKLRHNLSPEEIKKLGDSSIAKFKQTLDEVANLKQGEHTFANVVKKLGDAEREFSLNGSMCSFPKSVSTDQEVRNASTEATKKINEADVEFFSREDVYKSLLAFESKAKELSGEDKRFYDKFRLDFERNGLKLTPETRSTVTNLKKRISELGVEFNRRSNEDTSQIVVTKEELDGMDEDYLKRLSKTEDGKYIVTMKYPDAVPLMDNCKVEATRRKCEFAFQNRGGAENVKGAETAFALRHEAANILGYPNHSTYILEERMAKNPENVQKFLSSLRDRLTPKGQEELQRLVELKKKDCQERGLPFDGKINGWDFLFYHNLLLKTEYGVDDIEIMKYFPLDSTIQGTFDVYQELFQLKFKQLEKVDAWHPDVKQYEVTDATNDKFLGSFYLDLHPRDGKYGHAAVFPLQAACLDNEGKPQYPLNAMVCNFTKPTSESPSLLLHQEFETFFHEFGHVIHGICGHTKYHRFSGTRTERDFVECPSQALENWCWEKSILKRISKHHQTGEPLPDDLIDKLLASKLVNVSLRNLRQIFFGTLDQTIHTTAKTNSEELVSRLRGEITLIPQTPGTNLIANFGHLMGGYDSGYYGYLYSEVFSCDIYEQFRQQGVMNSDLGLQYRTKIISKGGSQDAMEYLIDFLGREPTQDAFLKSIGIDA